MNFFAEVGQIDATALQVGILVGALTALLICANQAVGLWRKLQPRPPIDEQMSHMEKTILARLADQDAKAEIRVISLHERINGHADRIGYIEGKLGIRNVS